MLNPKQFTGTEVILGILFGLVFFSIPILSWYTNDYDGASDFANGFSPLLSFFGSLLVYLALKSQIKANNILQQQLEIDKLTNQVESLNVKILNSEIKFKEEKISGYKIFEVLLQEIVSNQTSHANSRIRKIFEDQFSVISNSDLENFIRFFRNDGVNDFIVDDKLEELKVAAKDSNFSKYLTENFDFTEAEPDNNQVNKATTFSDIACGYFYKMDDAFKQSVYYFSYMKTYSKYNDFMESYNKRVLTILNSIAKMRDSEDSILYLKGILTTKEKIFLYQNLLASQKISIKETEILLKIISFSNDELLFNSSYLISPINNSMLENELRPIKNILTVN